MIIRLNDCGDKKEPIYLNVDNIISFYKTQIYTCVSCVSNKVYYVSQTPTEIATTISKIQKEERMRL